jgi:hypothetical protein
MSKRFVVSMVAVVTAAGIVSPLLRAQDNKWNQIPPPLAAYKGKTPQGTPPRRDLTGIWDAIQNRIIGASGAIEHPALFPPGTPGGSGSQGGHLDETGIAKPLPYTPLGLAALKANHPSGPGVRQVDSVLTNDPAGLCDPLGFPYMYTWELRTLNVVQRPKQVIILSFFYGNYRVIWTDGRQPPTDADPRYNGYSVGRWTDDYTFVVETTGLLEKTWLDHAGRPHSDQLKVEETYHRISLDTLELTVKITDPKMYTEPWLAINKADMHLLPDDFDVPELQCSPSEFAAYNDQLASPVNRNLPQNQK